MHSLDLLMNGFAYFFQEMSEKCSLNLDSMILYAQSLRQILLYSSPPNVPSRVRNNYFLHLKRVDDSLLKCHILKTKGWQIFFYALM